MPLAINVSSEPYPASGLSSTQLLHPCSVFTIFASHFAFIHSFKLCFLHACIDMDTCDIVNLSSDEETPFERNQRLLHEHHAEEDRRQVQSHLSRVLEEVKEGKRHTLRIAARPEPSRIPIAIPLALPLVVTIAYKPGELKFNIMSQESQTGTVSPAPIVEAECAPFGASKFQSTITNNRQISAILN